MKEINWDEAPEGFPIWIEASGDIGSGWHRDVGDRYEDQDGSFWYKPEEGFYTVYSKSENTPKFVPGDRVKVKSTAGVSRHATGVVSGKKHQHAAAYPNEYPVDVVWVLRDGASDACYFHPEELELVEAAQESNKTTLLVQKTTPKNDDSSEGITQPSLDNNAWFERGELPPIGSKVEFYSDDFDNEDYWNKDLINQSEVEIIAHIASSVRQNEADLAVFVFQYSDGDRQVEQAVPCCFRPIKTAEEIEAEARKKAVGAVEEQILEQMGELNVRNLAEHIVDTFGLRFTEEE